MIFDLDFDLRVLWNTYNIASPSRLYWYKLSQYFFDLTSTPRFPNTLKSSSSSIWHNNVRFRGYFNSIGGYFTSLERKMSRPQQTHKDTNIFTLWTSKFSKGKLPNFLDVLISLNGYSHSHCCPGQRMWKPQGRVGIDCQ